MKLPPITIMVWEYQLKVMLRALQAYRPDDPVEESHRLQAVEILETIAGRD